MKYSVAILLFAGASLNGVSKSNAQEKPNVIMVLVDDLGYSDLGSYGGEIETPNLDMLANNGIRFTQMHSCGKSYPSRATLLTGLYASQCGMNTGPDTFTNSISIGDLLKGAGYNTLFSGKNHSQMSLGEFGFDRIYEFLGGATNHFNPGDKRVGEDIPIFKGKYDVWNIANQRLYPYNPPNDFYSTDYFTNNAISFIEESIDGEDPFLLYLSYTAPHDPLMAWPEDIAKYRGKYMEGYEVIRKRRYEKMKQLGIVDPDMKLSDPTYESWELLSDEQRDVEDLKMSVYAAMIDRIDQNIGRLIDLLKEKGELENTLIMFASDNGCSAERAEDKVGGIGDIGTVSYWTSLQANWANVSNAPFRYNKQSSYEGGIASPFIIYCPSLVNKTGAINNQPWHFIDVLATLKDLTGAEYPLHYRGQDIVPMQGESFLPIIRGESFNRENPLYWQWGSGKAIRYGKWKASFIGKKWSLYNMEEDRNETTDLKEQYPKEFQELMNLFDTWIESTNNNKY